MDESHFKRLERMFHSAPIQEILPGAEMSVEEGKARYTLPIDKGYYHAADAMHGAVYFKMLDDAAYFAAASLETEYFILTKTYEIKFKRPVICDKLVANGEVIRCSDDQIIATSKVVNEDGKVVGEGQGIFVRGPRRLMDLPGYQG